MKAKTKRAERLVCSSIVLTLLLSLLFVTNFLQTSEAAEYPTKPIQYMVGYPPGGGSDTFARIVVDKLSSLLGQPVVVVNRAGGGGAVCVAATMATPADGYTIMSVVPPMFFAPYTVKGIAYDIIRDFECVSLSTLSPVVLVVGKDAPWQTIEQFIADAKKNPGKLNYATTGYGVTWLGPELIKQKEGLDVTFINMPGQGEIIPAVMGGHINMGSLVMSVSPQLKAGSLRALLIMDNERNKSFPNVPCSKDKGYPAIYSFQSAVVKAGTPQPIIAKLEKAYKDALSDKEIIEKIEQMGDYVKKGGSQEGEKFFVDTRDHFLEVLRTLKIVPK